MLDQAFWGKPFYFTESMDEVINLSTAFAGGDYTSIEYDPEYYNDYYDYNPEDYNHLDPQHLQQLQPDDGKMVIMA